MTTSNNPWDPQREPCCGSHVLGLNCCDQNDCGPCCENCPTCPTLAHRRGVEAGLDMANLAAEYHMRENPMNGDGSNTALKAVQGSIRLIREKTSRERAELLDRYMQAILRRLRPNANVNGEQIKSLEEAREAARKELERGLVFGGASMTHASRNLDQMSQITTYASTPVINNPSNIAKITNT